MDDLTTCRVVDTVARLRSGELTPKEVIDSAIARAQAAARLNAIVTETFEAARHQAPTEGAFAGVPTFIKDLSHVKGVATTWGSQAANQFIAKRSDAFVKRFAKTGIVSLGKSATPELGLTATTESPGRPPCRNPWDPTRSTGGSSGGAGALVAAGVVPLAHGSDGGGSIRIPAACCGVVGMKPSRGTIDMEGSRLLPINIATNGVLTRSVDDTIAFYDALGLHVGSQPKPAPLRIAVFVDSPIATPVHPDTQVAVRAAAKLCETLGHHVEEISCPFGTTVNDDFLTFWGFVAWIQLKTARYMLHRGFDATHVDPWTTGIARMFVGRKRATWSAVRRLRRFARAYAHLFETHDVLISPTTAEPAPLIGYLAADLPFETHYERLRAYAPFTPIQNVAGAPAISLPLGRSSSGLPIGVQFAGTRGADRTLLELARTIDAAQPWPRIAPHENWQ